MKKGRRGRLSDHAGRNASERRAGLETNAAEADPPIIRGRPPAVGKRATQAPTVSAGYWRRHAWKRGMDAEQVVIWSRFRDGFRRWGLGTVVVLATLVEAPGSQPPVFRGCCWTAARPRAGRHAQGVGPASAGEPFAHARPGRPRRAGYSRRSLSSSSLGSLGQRKTAEPVPTLSDGVQHYTPVSGPR